MTDPRSDEQLGGTVKSAGGASQPPRSERGNRALRWFIYVGVFVLVVSLISRQKSGPEVGAEAANFVLPTTNEGSFDLASRRGNPVLIEIFASWCASCERAMPALRAAFEAPRQKPVCFVGVSVDKTPEAARALKQAWGVPYDVAVDDGSVASSYDVSVLPTFVLLGADGTVRHVATGAPSRADIENWLAMVDAAPL